MLKSHRMNRLFTACLIAVLSFSCGKDDDGPAPAQLQTCLSKIITGSSTTTYQYDQDNRVVSSTVEFSSSPASNYSSTYTYNSSGQLIEWMIDNANSADNTKLVYSYNESGKISETKTYVVSGSNSTLYRTTTPNYATSGKISVMTFNEGDLMPYLEYEYFLDTKGNMTKRIQYSGLGSTLSTDEYVGFDDKNAALLSIPKTNVTSNVNNFLTLKQTNSSGTVTNTTYTHEYNAEGYPTKRTSSSGAVVTYEYIKK